MARAETALFDWRVRVLKVNQLADQVGSYEVTFPVFAPDITDKAAHTEATEALARAKHERDQDKLLLGRALDADAKEGDALGKFSRAKGAWNGRFFGPSTSSDSYRTDAGIVPRPRFWMPLRWSQEIPNDELLTDLRGAASAAENIFLAKQSH